MDYSYISKSGGHLLVTIDTISRKTFLKHMMNKDARTAVKGLLESHSNFILEENFIIVTDHGSHFSNQIMQYAVHALRGRHEFSIIFVPWTNGSCESRDRHNLRILRQLCSELPLTDKEWPA